MLEVLFTGGTRGIGRALAEALQQQGSEVMVCGSRADTVREMQRDTGIRCVTCDLTRSEDIERLVSAVRGELGGLDILVNNAGVQQATDFVDGPDMATRSEPAVVLQPVR